MQEVVFVHGDTTLEATTYPVAGDADFTSILVLRDVTAQARLERARRDLIANASHEFKTPLFSLAGLPRAHRRGQPERRRAEPSSSGLMRQQVDRLRNLAVSMLDLSKVEAGSLRAGAGGRRPGGRRPLGAGRVPGPGADQGADAGRRGRRARHRLVRRAAPCPGAARARRQRRQVLAARQQRAHRRTRRGKWATVVVSDDGPGIPAAELPHVFERFHRGSEERATTTGAGLGLSIARELTEMMGGTIRAEAGQRPRRQLLRAPAPPAPQTPGGGPRRGRSAGDGGCRPDAGAEIADAGRRRRA